MADASSTDIETDGTLIYEYEPIHNHHNLEKHWWMQAEAMICFFNAWQLTGEQKYYDLFTNSWTFINKHIIDHDKGEWIWGIHSDNPLMDHEGKVGLWNCPCHNSRACMEIIRRLEA